MPAFWDTLRRPLLDKMYKYEMDPTRTVGATQDVGWTDWQTDERMEWNQYTPPQQLRRAGGIMSIKEP